MILHLIRVLGAYFIQIIAWIHPLDTHLILFYAFDRKGICCNPKYIMKELISSYQDQYHLFWISKWPETCEKGDGYKIVRLRSVKFYVLSGYAKYVITNDRLDEYMIKRKGQVYINTWHGGGTFKKAGYDIIGNGKEATTKETIDSFYNKDDFLIVSSKYLEKQFMKAFHMNTNQILSFGMPRSDVFYKENDIYRAVRKKYAIPNETRIVLYAPTYRFQNDIDPFIPKDNVGSLLNDLTLRFGGNWIFFYRMHYFDKEDYYDEVEGKVVNCSDYYDAQELLCGIDILITDYSSLLWDFTLLGKPSFRYAPDIGMYEKTDRQFYWAYEKWPYPHSSTLDGLLEQIRTYDHEIYKKKMDEYLDSVGNFDKGNSSGQFVEWLVNRGNT